MSPEERQKRRLYNREWQRQKRRKLGIEIRRPQTEEERILAKIKRKEYEKEWNKNHPYSSRDLGSRLLSAAKSRAKQEEVPFNITKEDIIIPSHCPYLGILLVNTSPRGYARNNVASLDKIIPSLGYVKGNIEVISQQANTMKSNATIEELISFAKEVLRRYELCDI